MNYYNYYQQQDNRFYDEDYHTNTNLSQIKYHKRPKLREERIPSSHYYDYYQEPSSYIDHHRYNDNDSPDYSYYVPNQKKQKSKYYDRNNNRGMTYEKPHTTNDNNSTGEEILNYADNDDEEEDVKTQMNTIINSESIIIDDGNENDTTTIITNNNRYNTNLNQEEKKSKWFKNIRLVLVKKVKDFRKRNDKPTKSAPLIQMITATDNELLGDVLDAKQQKEIITQLSTCASPMSFNNMSPEKTKITNLSRIWVFRLLLEEQTYDEPIAWIGFDYENQIKIENHVKELQNNMPEDGRLAIYDSHIRHGKMPVIVTPNQTKGYYFSDDSQTQLITLQVTFIENNHQKVTFVYRV